MAINSTATSQLTVYAELATIPSKFSADSVKLFLFVY